jgi:octaheme c-type cytochrome (tetrathionate reductase family)
MQRRIYEMKPQIFIATALALTGLGVGASSYAVTEHQEITGPFATPMEVTQKCLECHEDAAHDIMLTSHWTWSLEQRIVDKGKVNRGKKDVINNFCISINSNWPRCTSCHISYGWKDANFDFSDSSRIDCLICHDTTGKYKKPGPAAGMPAGYTGNEKFDKKPVDLVAVAQNVGKPTRENCLACHGYGGGGDNVKHGDIDSLLDAADSSYDFHMGTDGLDYSCQVCHTTLEHKIKGNAMVVSPGNWNHLDCTDCHDPAPHKQKRLNNHIKSVACQTCHIPFFAKGMPTKLEWDWSTAGQDKEGEKDKYGKPTYDKKKGNFIWGKNVIPVYAWYNGNASAYSRGDTIDPTKVTKLNWPEGNINDMNSKIYPFKVHKGKQIYDKKNNYFITPKLWPGGADKEEAYWKSYDWNRAAAAGMKASGLPYSGEYGFAPTEMYWRLNHMVAPAKAALQCNDCHGTGGRMDWKALGYEGDPQKIEDAARMGK